MSRHCDTARWMRAMSSVNVSVLIDSLLVLSHSPRSRGCGPQQRILSRCPPLIPGLGNTHSITDKSMVVLDTMDLEARAIVHRGVHEHHWGKEGKHHGCCGRGSQTFIARNVPL